MREPTSGTVQTAAAHTAELSPGVHEALPPPTNDAAVALSESYERQVGTAPVVMDFIGFPQSVPEARSLASIMAANLLNLSRHNLKPLVIMEPTCNDGTAQMDLTAFGRGAYTEALRSFFAGLHEAGVTDKQMGMWVPFPEPNDPNWAKGVTDAQLFVRNVTAVSRTLKAVFPKTPVSVMLDSQTCTNADWSNCTMASSALYPYLLFPRGVVDAMGLQGFTWDAQDSPDVYLSGTTAAYAARLLGVRNIWFNTGTYAAVNNQNGEGILHADNARRTAVLSGVMQQAAAVQEAGLRVGFINVFAEDKFDPTHTGTADYAYKTAADRAALRTFVDLARARHIPVTIFDAPETP